MNIYVVLAEKWTNWTLMNDKHCLPQKDLQNILKYYQQMAYCCCYWKQSVFLKPEQ